MPPSVVTDPGLLVTDHPTQSVAVIDYLGSPAGWVHVPHLFCDRLTVGVNSVDEAALRYEFGASVMQPGTSFFAEYAPLDLRGKYVRITIDSTPAIVWYGYVATARMDRAGVRNVDGQNKFVGEVQAFQCFGLEYFLARRQIASAVVRVGPDTIESVRIGRALVFNGGAEDRNHAASQRGNRSPVINADGQFDFVDDFTTGELWSAEDILWHVLKYHSPEDSSGNPAPAEYVINNSDSITGFLDGFYPTLAAEGMTAAEVLNRLCQPQRGVVWWLEYREEPTPVCEIRVQSLATAAIALPGGGTLPGNTNQVTLDFDQERDVRFVAVQAVGQRDYDRIVARGARQTATMTIGQPDQTMALDWSQDGAPNANGSEPKYKAAAVSTAGYAELAVDKKKERNDAYRRADVFDRVYSAFRIPIGWDGKTGDGATSPRNWALPVLSTTGSVLGGLAIHNQGLRLLNTLRVYAGWNYSQPASPQPNSPDATLAEFARPFAFVQVASSPDRWQLCENLDESSFAEGSPVSTNIETTFHLIMQRAVPGLRLVARGAAHALALNHWADAQPTAHEPEVDYATLRATVCCEADAFCEGIYPTTGLPANKPINELVIEVGEQYRLDFLPAHTVWGLSNGVPQTSGEHGAVLRDDRPYLNDLARMAFEWYRLDRNAIAVTFRQVRPLLPLGALVTAIGEGTTQTTVNTVVSTIIYDFLDGTTQVKTHDDTLDIRSLG